jgi:hypothetical protein
MRGGWNPVRRNRNIGTPLRGRGRSNAFFSPLTRRPVAGVSATERRIVGGQEITFITEKTFPGFVHACTVDDILRVLAALPPEDWAGIQAIVFRQLTRKENMLAPRWGQITFGAAGTDGAAHEATVFLAAARERDLILWPTSIVPAEVAGLDRLRQDGHEVRVTPRGSEIVSTLAAVRVTQLCRTIPHEVGHWIDYRTRAVRGDDYEARSIAVKEAFAEQYAAKVHGRVFAALLARRAA